MCAFDVNSVCNGAKTTHTSITNYFCLPPLIITRTSPRLGPVRGAGLRDRAVEREAAALVPPGVHRATPRDSHPRGGVGDGPATLAELREQRRQRPVAVQPPRAGEGVPG